MAKKMHMDANLAETPSYLHPRETLPLGKILPEFKTDNKLFNPGNEPVKLQVTRNNNRQVIAAENISDQGIYEWSESSNFDKKAAFAVNLRREESDMTTIRPQVLSDITGLDTIKTAETDEELLRLIQENLFRGQVLMIQHTCYPSFQMSYLAFSINITCVFLLQQHPHFALQSPPCFCRTKQRFFRHLSMFLHQQKCRATNFRVKPDADQ